MAIVKPSIPKGTRDFGPEQVAKRRFIINTIEAVFIKYGFMPIETPAMENLSTLSGKYGDEGDQLLFKILNSGDYLKEIKEVHSKGLAHEEMDHTFLPSYSGKVSDMDSRTTLNFISEKGLRYDLTVPFARFVVMHQNEISYPFKRYQMQPVWRADKPQKGRYREFWQCDADVIGSDAMLNEAELLQVYIEVFKRLHIPITIKINHRKILQGLMMEMNATDKFNEVVIGIDKLDKIGLDKVKDELRNAGVEEHSLDELERILQLKESMGILPEGFGIIEELFTGDSGKNETGMKGLWEVKEIFELMQLSQQLVSEIKLDISLARGLNYYTGCIFEVVVNDEQSAFKSSIGGGGRYDNLTGMFGLPNVSGVGISFGLDRMYDVMEELNLFPAVIHNSTELIFCTFDENAWKYALPLLKMVRESDIAAEIYPKVAKMKKQLDYANNKKISYACIIGDNEIQSGKLVFKDLNSGNQESLSIDEIISRLIPNDK